MKQSGDYWKESFRQLEEAQNNSSVSKAQEIQEQFERAQAAMNGKINAWYQRFAANNGISMAEARRMLSEKELKEFQWNVEDYIKHGEENAVSHAWEKQLENASARVHISRLEALKLEVQQELEKMYGNYLDSVDRHIKDIYESDFYHTAYEIQKGIGVGSSLQKLDQNLVEKIISKPWAVDGKNFSDRIWENKTKLINQVHNSLSVMCITGDAPDRAISEIAKIMNVSRHQAGQLVMTESAAFANRAREDCMKTLGVEEFKVVETLDSITCEYCQSMDGKHFPMKEFQIGVTAPPFHPFCRGCMCPYFEDEFTAGEERAARGEDGKTYYVPSDMSYEDWKKLFVDGDTAGLQEVKPDGENSGKQLFINNNQVDDLSKQDNIADSQFKEIQSVQNGVVEGENLVNDIDYSKSNLDFTIEKAMNAQGFDGMPKVVEYEEFQKAMKESNFYAERTYTADTQKLLDAYQNELYNGKWYVDCSEGGAQYGQGMYCASCYDIKNKEQMVGIGSEMRHYQQVGASKGNEFSCTESITLQTNAKILELPKGVDTEEYITDIYKAEYLKKYATPEQMKYVERYIDYDSQIQKLTYNEDEIFIESLYQKRADATIGIENLIEDALSAMEDKTDGKKYHGLKNPGALAVEMGYDAIKATGHGDSGSYTVILNRTKVIFCRGGSIYGN